MSPSSLHLVLQIWEIKTKRVRNAFKGFAHSLDFSLSPNGRLLYPLRNVQLWNKCYGSAKILTDASHDVLSLWAVFSPDGVYVAAFYFDGLVRGYVRTGQFEKAGDTCGLCV